MVIARDVICECAYYDYDKPKGQKRLKTRRNVVQDMYGKRMKTEAAITKTVYDPKNKLTKKEFALLSSGLFDGMSSVVRYSMNKHNLWEMTPYNILRNTENPYAEVLVLERKLTHQCGKWYYRHDETNFRFAHFTDKDGNLVKKISARMGTRLKNLLTDHGVHKVLNDCKCCRSWNEDPRVEYRIFSAHENQWITSGMFAFGGEWEVVYFFFYNFPYNPLFYQKCENFNNIYIKASEIYYEEETERYRDRRFCLGDFIVDKPLNRKEWVILPSIIKYTIFYVNFY